MLVALGALHPVLSTSMAAGGTFAIFRFLEPPRTRDSRVVACTVSTIVATVAIGCAFAYFPLLGWIEVGAGIGAAGVWLASEGA